MSDKSKKTQATVGKLYQDLQDILQWFEDSSEVDVDESLKKYEQAQKIAKDLKTQLAKVENKIKTIDI